MALNKTSKTFFKLAICILTMFSFAYCRQKTSESSTTMQNDDNQAINVYVNAALIDFGNQVNHNKHRFDGVNAMAYELMRKAYPNSSYNDLMSKVEEMPNDLEIENTFLKALYKQSANPETVHFYIYALSHDQKTTQIVEEYCNNRFGGK
jgi:metal-dependent HD superfamily phosphatase/phosphodiesterase